MSQNRALSLYVCACCLRTHVGRRASTISLLKTPASSIRRFATKESTDPSDVHRKTENLTEDTNTSSHDEKAMSRRLFDLAESNLEDGGRGAQKAVEEAGFDAELKERLLARIQDAQFRNENAAAFSHTTIPSSAGQGTREAAAAAPWAGIESTEDAALRMLDDAHKPIKIPFKIPSPRGAPLPPKRVDTGRTKKSPSTGARLANARDKSSRYSFLKDDGLSEQEREQMRKQLKDRFTANARPAPVTVQGLASLANERIEDAIARGQFKNLPRGKKIERDYNMSSPFIDTTEYFMNKIIQKQEIVPPWIEKQQELVATVTKFRARIRNDWRRHAARLIASAGGPLDAQLAQAREYAAAEALTNPPKRKGVRLNTIDRTGNISRISIIQDRTAEESSDTSDMPATVITVTEDSPADMHDAVPEGPLVQPESASGGEGSGTPHQSQHLKVFRSPSWEAAERAYHNAAIDNLNSMTRSYNLMAPNLAKKPYYNYERELKNMYADVAPQLADAIQERAVARPIRVNVVGRQEGGLLENLSGGTAKIYDEQRPRYGLREFWRDLFSSREAN